MATVGSSCATTWVAQLAATTASAVIRTHGLTHISLSVSDLDASLAFYSTLFGVREYFRDETSLQVLGPGEYDVIAFELRDLRSRGGIHHFGFRLVDAEQVHEAARLAKELGATILRQKLDLAGLHGPQRTPGDVYL